MKISNELLSSYAEGHVTDEERNKVRKYLTEHPDNLESLASMMDDDYELEPFAGPESVPTGDIAMNYDVPSDNDSFCPQNPECADSLSLDDACDDSDFSGLDSRMMSSAAPAFSGLSLFSAFAPSHKISFGSHRLIIKDDYRLKKSGISKMAEVTTKVVPIKNEADIKLLKAKAYRHTTFSERLDNLLDSLKGLP